MHAPPAKPWRAGAAQLVGCVAAAYRVDAPDPKRLEMGLVLVLKEFLQYPEALSTGLSGLSETG